MSIGAALQNCVQLRYKRKRIVSPTILVRPTKRIAQKPAWTKWRRKTTKCDDGGCEGCTAITSRQIVPLMALASAGSYWNNIVILVVGSDDTDFWVSSTKAVHICASDSQVLASRLQTGIRIQYILQNKIVFYIILFMKYSKKVVNHSDFTRFLQPVI